MGVGLSAAGEARRGEMLGVLQRAMTARRRRRAAGRVGAVVAAVALVGISVSSVWRGGGTGAPSAGDGALAVAREALPLGAVEMVRDDPGIVARVAARPAMEIRTIDDDELERLLEEAGRPSGLVRTGGRVYLASSLGAGAP